MLVSMWMTRDPIAVSPAMSIADAAREMSRRHIRRVIVAETTHRGAEVRGIVSLKDVARAMPPDGNPLSVLAGDVGNDAFRRQPLRTVSEIMTRHPRTVSPDTPIEEAVALLLEEKIGALPVVRDGLLVGIITESDVFRAFLEVIGVERATVRVTFDVGEHEDPVAAVMAIAARHDVRVASIVSMKHAGKRLGVVRLSGHGSQHFVDEIWRSGHRVLSVLGVGTRSGVP